jgi:hypothetical protein
VENGENYIMRGLVICTPHRNVAGVIKSRRMRCGGHVARMGENRGVYRVLVGKKLWKETTLKTQA